MHAVCDPREVRKVDAVKRDDGTPHQMAADSDVRDFSVIDTPASYVLTAAINACRLQQDSLGGCIGFGIETPSNSGGSGHRVTLLYNSMKSVTTAYTGKHPEVYSIEACL